MSRIKIGVIKTIRPDFGFIHCDDGNDYFYHETKIKDDKDLSVGDPVEFELSDYIPKGKRLPPVSGLWKRKPYCQKKC